MSLRRLLLMGLALAVGSVVAAQVQLPFRGRGRNREPIPESAHVPYDGQFAFVRLRYASNLGGFGFRREPPWSHDYPRGERNFMKILKEVPYLTPHLNESNILTLDDPELFNFPVAYMCEPGYWTLTDAEAAGFGAYLKKGGLAIFDDFRGSDWENFEQQIRTVLPDARLVELDATHPIFHSFFEINSLEFVQYYDSGTPLFMGVFEDNDPKKRLLLIANYNNDISEYWEFSDTGFVPIDLSNEAYKFGVNYIVYGMTH